MELGGDPEQTTLTADRDTTKSTGARNFAGNDPREIINPDHEGIGAVRSAREGFVPRSVDRNFPALPTLQENLGASMVEMDSHEPFEGEEEKIPFWEDESVREARRSSTVRMLSTVQNLTDIADDEDQHDEDSVITPRRHRTDAMSDATFRSHLESESHSERPSSPTNVGRGGGKGLGKWRSPSSASSGDHNKHTLLNQLWRMSLMSQHSPSGRLQRHDDGQNLPENGHRPHGLNGVARSKLTNRDEEMLSDSEADYDAFDNASERVSKKLLSPNFRFFRIYATYMLLVLLLFVFFMPIRVGFFPRGSGVWHAIDILWNVIFLVDIVIRLNTGFVDKDNGKVVYDRRAIFMRYARRWLIVDLLAAFPFTFIPGLGPHDKHGNHEIAYFLTLPKVFQLYELMSVVQEYHKIHQGAFLGIRTLLSVTVTAHLFGCGWYILATRLHQECEDLYVYGVLDDETVFMHSIYGDDVSSYIANECPWIYRNDYYIFPLGRRYLGSVYWALTTLTTVGYGDLSARTVDEQIYSMCVQVVGVAWYGYIVGTWATVLNSFDSEEQEQRNKMRQVVAFSKAAGLQPALAKKVRQHFRFALYRKDNWITFNEHEIVDDLPASLRADVIMCIHHNTIEQIAWFKNKDPTFIADVVVNLKPRLFRPGDDLFREGTQPEELFFITSGMVILKHGDNTVGSLRQEKIAGLLGLLSKTHKLTATVVQKKLVSFGLSRVHFLELMERYPEEMQELMLEAKSLAQKISETNKETKKDFMANPVLAQLIGRVRSPTHRHDAVNLTPTRWRIISHDDLGQVPHRFDERTLPRENQREVEKQASTGGGLHTDSSDSDGESAEPVREDLVLSTGAGSAVTLVRGEGNGNGAGNASGESLNIAGDVRDVVAREVSRRMDVIEARIFTVLEGFVGRHTGDAGTVTKPVAECANSSPSS